MKSLASVCLLAACFSSAVLAKTVVNDKVKQEEVPAEIATLYYATAVGRGFITGY
jgi:hypothetical protein